MIATGYNLLVPVYMVIDKRENVPLIRVKKLICRYFFSTRCKISNYTKPILVRALLHCVIIHCESVSICFTPKLCKRTLVWCRLNTRKFRVYRVAQKKVLVFLLYEIKEEYCFMATRYLKSVSVNLINRFDNSKK